MRFDANRFGFQSQAQIFGEADDAAVLDPGVGLELERGDDGAGVYAVYVARHGKLFALFGEYRSPLAQLLFGLFVMADRGFEQIKPRQLIDSPRGCLDRCFAADRFRPRAGSRRFTLFSRRGAVYPGR